MLDDLTLFARWGRLTKGQPRFDTALTLGAETVPVRTMAILANDADSDGVRIEATTDTRALLIAGRPLGEPIAQYGPFVMNTEQEIYQAVADYRAGRLAA